MFLGSQRDDNACTGIHDTKLAPPTAGYLPSKSAGYLLYLVSCLPFVSDLSYGTRLFGKLYH